MYLRLLPSCTIQAYHLSSTAAWFRCLHALEGSGLPARQGGSLAASLALVITVDERAASEFLFMGTPGPLTSRVALRLGPVASSPHPNAAAPSAFTSKRKYLSEDVATCAPRHRPRMCSVKSKVLGSRFTSDTVGTHSHVCTAGAGVAVLTATLYEQSGSSHVGHPQVEQYCNP
jgi:hypothetical protein